jgi:hypothetical protein
MIVDNLYSSALVKPNLDGNANRLYIVSGYASATFARRHIVELLATNENFEINLIIGMPKAKSDHMAFLLLHKEFKGRFNGYYFQSQPPVHCKVYSWFDGNKPFLGFAGSANYSQFGFFSHQQLNQLSEEDPVAIKKLYDELIKKSIFIPDHKIVLPTGHRIPHIKSVPPGEIEWEIPDKRVTISFLDKTGILPKKSGLNWGQRLAKSINKKTGKISFTKRNPNQAYLSIKGDARKHGFLPEKKFTFTVLTDDKQTLDCVVAQDGRKSVETTYDNSILGNYIRNRIKLPSGAPITVEDLEKYGRTDFTLEKINDETFLLDFSV